VRWTILRCVGVVAAMATALVTQVIAGEVNVSWDSVPGSSGYHVYYGTQSGTYGNFISTGSNSATITGLQDCQTYYVAVKAFNAAGESAQFSNELSGWARPVVTSVTPSAAMQGDQIVMDISGANYQPGALVTLNNPNVILTSVSVVNCTHVQLLATVEPTGPHMRAALVGKLDITIANPDNVFGMRSQAFEVLIDPSRYDVNKSDPATTDRIDGKDTIYLSRDFGQAESVCRAGMTNQGAGCDPTTEATAHVCSSASVASDCIANASYDPDKDFNGDSWVDGADLSLIASNLGRCWSSSTKSWSLAACPSGLQ